MTVQLGGSTPTTMYRLRRGLLHNCPLSHRHTSLQCETNVERIRETVASRPESSIQPACWIQRILPV